VEFVFLSVVSVALLILIHGHRRQIQSQPMDPVSFVHPDITMSALQIHAAMWFVAGYIYRLAVS
jgi:hypothetical protein